MKKVTLATAALMIAAQIAPAQAGASDVKALQSVQAAVEAGDTEAVKALLAQFPNLATMSPSIIAELNQFIAAPKPKSLLKFLGFKPRIQRVALAMVADTVASIY